MVSDIDIDIEAIEKLIDEATEAPFEIDGDDPCGVWGRGGSVFVGDMTSSEDARLLVAVLNSIQALIAEVRRLRVENEDAMRGRREATQTIIDAIGSVGPESIEDAERRIADEVVRLRAKVAAGDRLAEAVEAAGERDDRGVLACVPALLAYREVKP